MAPSATRYGVQHMSVVKTFIAMLAVFAVGVVAGALKSRIVGALRIGLGLPDRTLGIDNPYYQAGIPPAEIKSNIGSIVGALAREHIRIVLQNVIYAVPRYRPGLNDKVSELNRSLSDLRSPPAVSWLDLNQVLADSEGLSPSFSSDGLHLNTSGYLVWKKEISALLPP